MLKFIKNNKAFSIIGVLVASSIGLIVITGLTKMFVHMSSQITQLEQKAQLANLISLIGNTMTTKILNDAVNCTATLKQVTTPAIPPRIKAGNKADFYKIKSNGGGDIVDLNASNLQTQYGLEGFVKFEVECAESSCNCSSPPPTPTSPCTKRWSVSLISQSRINNALSFNRIMKIPITVNYTGTGNNDFTCI
ncbi:MAG: hypothetical protein OXN83_04375 [Oligoflexia bacterium]|nr:hypothetical protein [Oligoflexia bacterium]